MFENGKVLWKEGMFLQPQHFQQAERNCLFIMNKRLSLHAPFFYGITELDIDHDALNNNLFTIVRCSGVLPDGTFFSIPGEDMPPQSRFFTECFTYNQPYLDIFLALPLVHEGQPGVSGTPDDSHHLFRYKAKNVSVTDDISGTNHQDLELGKHNFKIIFGTESLDSFSYLPLCRLMRSPNGHSIIDNSFMPPFLQIGASDCFITQLRGLLEILSAKIGSLSAERKQKQGGRAEFSPSKNAVSDFLVTLTTYTPLLDFHCKSRFAHPFEVYSLLMMLAGALCAFASDVPINEFPLYNHRQPSEAFLGLITIIRKILEAAISTGCTLLPIERISDTTYSSRLPTTQLPNNSRLFFGVSAKVSEKELIVGILQRVKMCSNDRIELLIASAMPGITLIHAAHPPENVPVKPGFVYFYLDQTGQYWEGIKTSGTISFYFPNNYPDLNMELILVNE